MEVKLSIFASQHEAVFCWLVPREKIGSKIGQWSQRHCNNCWTCLLSVRARSLYKIRFVSGLSRSRKQLCTYYMASSPPYLSINQSMILMVLQLTCSI